jgi:RNA polymerase sigma-70 factor (ECF subfamily)
MSVSSRTDAQAIADVLAGDTESFGVLVQRYQDPYFRYAARMLGDADDADDALQSAFVRAFRQLASCRDRNRFGAWLFQIVINECRTLAFRRDRRERRMVRDERELDVPMVVSSNESAELPQIEKALATLDTDHREAFLLKHVQELSYDEMAELTGASVSALKMRVKRACDRMAQMLDNSRSLI